MDNSWVSSLKNGGMAGVMAIIATVLVEKCGGRIGGIIATMPFTFVPASYVFVTSANATIDWQLGLGSIPAGGIGSIAFMQVWEQISKCTVKYSTCCRLTTLSILSCVVWLSVCYGLIYLFFKLRDYPKYIFPGMYIVDFIHLSLCVYLSWSPQKSLHGKKSVSFVNYFSRGILAFVAIYFAAVIMKHGSVIYASVCCLAPAILLTTMVSMWISHGEKVAIGAIAPMTLGWNAYNYNYIYNKYSWPTYACLFATFKNFTDFNIFIDILLALLSTVVLISTPVSFYLSWRERVTAKYKEVEMEKIEVKVEEKKDKKKDDENNKKEKKEKKEDKKENKTKKFEKNKYDKLDEEEDGEEVSRLVEKNNNDENNK